jgi:hypothetical protein
VTTTKTLAYSCLGADSATQTLLNELGPSEGYPKNSDGNYYIPSQYSSSATVPKFLENGQTFAVNFSASLVLSSSLTSQLPDGSTLKISGALKWTVSGGGTGGPYNGSPTSGTVTISGGKPVAPLTPITASGTVTGTDVNTPIIYSLVSPFDSSIVVTIPGTTPTVITLNLACTSSDPAVAATNGSLPPTTTTTAAPTTTTTAAPAPVNTNPSFTG